MNEFLVFGYKQARACIFAVSLFGLMVLSYPIASVGIPRYDFIFAGAIGVQVLLVVTKQETRKEAGVVSLFHLVGLGLELFKTHPAINSWTYPETSFFRIETVPLYSGFMYAAVGSYVLQAWKLLKLEFKQLPPALLSLGLTLAGYTNFFTKHFVQDAHWWMIGLTLIVFSRTTVSFTVIKKRRSMSLNLSFVLIAFFIWIAENIATFLGAWQYPGQSTGWNLVHTNKISSWFLLFLISFLLVVFLKKSVKRSYQ